MGPPSSGGGILLEILNILTGFDPGKRRLLDFHHLVEASKLAFADRATFYGDSDFVDVPLARLLSMQHAADLRGRIDPDRAQGVPTRPAAVEHGGTSHLSAIDASGYAAALTTTINTSFGSMLVAPGTGIILNNEMADFTAAPGVPNVYGLIGTEANSIEPGKRPLSSMSPTLVLRERQPVLAIGASGGPHIISATLQVILNIIDVGLPLPAAVAAPRLYRCLR
jgi:gamma-glutamyltranspeptidase/glutathione hydrolase